MKSKTSLMLLESYDVVWNLGGEGRMLNFAKRKH